MLSTSKTKAYIKIKWGSLYLVLELSEVWYNISKDMNTVDCLLT